MSEKTLTGVGARLQWVMGDRSAWKWAKLTGLTPGTIGRMIKEDLLPGAAKLIHAARVENLSLTWLCTGEGAPFLVTPVATRREAMELFMDAIDRSEWHVDILACSDRFTLVLHGWQESESESEDDEPYRWRRVQVLVGAPLGYAMLNEMHWPSYAGSSRIHHTRISDDQWQRLATGWIGTFGLFGDENNEGLITRNATELNARPISTTGEIAEDSQSYVTMDADTAEAINIIDSIEPAARKTVLDMIRGLRRP